MTQPLVDSSTELFADTPAAGSDDRTPTSEATPPAGRESLTYEPALDGIRGAAIIAILLYHAQFDFAKGGFLSVSTFFTLSGFLITSLLLIEHRNHGRISPKTFYSKRMRRLMPMALAGIGVALVVTVLVGDAGQRDGFGADVFFAEAYVANWHYMLSDTSYANLFVSPSPLLHYWSLAIEEQFYAVVPLLVILLAKWGGLTRKLMIACGVGIAGALALSVALSSNHDYVYFNTFCRAGELLMGVLLAVLVQTHGVLERKGIQRWLRFLGPLAAVVMLAMWVTVGTSADWLYEGGFIAYSVLSAIVISACLAPGSVIRTAFAAAPLQKLGRVSYGVYVLHFPIFILLTPQRLGLPSGITFVIRVGVTLAIAIALFHWLETPIRTGSRLKRRPLIVATLVAVALLIPSIVLSVTTENEAAALPTGPAADSTNGGPSFAIFGDSTALSMTPGLEAWAGGTRLASMKVGLTPLGCGLFPATRVRIGSVEGKACDNHVDDWALLAAKKKLDYAIILVGAWDVGDQMLADGTWLAPGDEKYDQVLKERALALVDGFAATDTKTIWLTNPQLTRGRDRDELEARGASADPARMAEVNNIYKSVAAERPDASRAIDFGAWMDSLPEEERIEMRPDGVHFNKAGSIKATDRFLGGALADLLQTFPPFTRTERDAADPKTVCATISNFLLTEISIPVVIGAPEEDVNARLQRLTESADRVRAAQPNLGPSLDERIAYWKAAVSSPKLRPGRAPADTPRSGRASAAIAKQKATSCGAK